MTGASLLLILAAQAPATTPQPEAVAVVQRFLTTLRSGRHNRLGPLVTDRVADGEGRSLRRDQIILLHQGYTEMMFGPLRSFECEPPASNSITCTLHFQSRYLRQRYTVASGLISGLETLPAVEPGDAK